MITSEFDKFCFHDARVIEITRDNGSISCEFESAFMSKDHPESGGNDWVIDQGVLQLCNVSKEVALFWYDSIEGKSHPRPELPLDEISSLEFNGAVFDFGGFLNREPWAQWLVYASEFKIEIKSKHIESS
ncbi:hypothetical protein [Spongorhabdus nitratireducens]